MSKPLHERYKIARLITKNILGEASEDEKRQLEAWLEASPSHVHEYTQWIKRLEHDLGKDEPSPYPAWQRFNRRMHPRRSRLFKTSYLYAYAAVFLLAIVFGVLVFYHPETPVNTAIVPGSAKAQLITESGEDIEIKPKLQIEFAQKTLEKKIHNEDGILHYDRLNLPADSLKDTYHTLNIPKGGEYQLVLADGTHIYLNSDSRIKYPVVFTETDSVRQVYIKGEAYFKVAHDEKRPFKVHTQHGVIEVLGTKFNVHDYADEPQVVITLSEGSIAYSPGQKEHILRPNEQIVYHKEGGQLTRRTVDASSYSSWIDGIFEFNSMPLEQIMKQLSRWYDVDYEFNDPRLTRHQFTGITYRHATLESLLQLIEKTTNIHFKIKNRTIYISN